MNKSAQSGRNQGDRFIETARQLGVDEDEGRFLEKLAVIARQKPKDPPKPEPGSPPPKVP